MKAAVDLAYGFDVYDGDVIAWITDMGWLIGPLLVVGGLQLGATIVLGEGVPTHPTTGPAVDHGHPRGGDPPRRGPHRGTRGQSGPAANHPPELPTLRAFVSTGEPWDEPTWRAAVRAGRPLPPTRHQLQRRHRGRRPHPRQLPDPPDGARRLQWAASRHGRRRARRGRQARDRGDRRARDPQHLARHDARLLARHRARYLSTYWSHWDDTWHHGDLASVDEHGDMAASTAARTTP